MSRLARLVPPGAGWLLASGALLALAHPPFHLLLPSFVALVPFAWWLERLPDGEEGRRRARRGGFLLGLVYYTLVFYWLLVALIWYTPLAVLAFLAPVLILSVFLAFTAQGVFELRRGPGWPVWAALPVLWTANEWFRSHIPDVAFPWMQLGATLTGHPRLIGAADLVGTRGLSFWLVLVNALLAVALLRAWRRRSASGGADRASSPPSALAPALAVVAVLLVPIGYSLARWSSLALRPAATVGVIQPNVPEHIKLDRYAAADSARAATEALLRTRAGAWRGRVDLLLLPETAIPLEIEPLPSRGFPGRPEWEAWAAGLARRLDAAVLYGAIGLEDLGDGDYVYYNSAFHVSPAGWRTARYDKRYLVPIVERVPFLDPRWFSGLDYFGGFGVGREAPVLPAGDAGFGVMICYESIYTQLARRYRRGGADFLVNITNDAWFGREEPWWARSSALWQHPAHLVMRAVETRMGVARAANTGISLTVDPLGRVAHATPLFTADAFDAEVLTTDGLTPYVRWGDVVGWSAVLVTLLGLALLGVERLEGRGGGG